MDPQWEHTMQAVLFIAAVGIAALAAHLGLKLGYMVYRELYLCGGFC